MRETFKLRACERVDPGFLTTVEFMRRKVHGTLKTSSGFGIRNTHLLCLMSFVSLARSNLSKRKSILVAPASKTMNKGLRDGADILDERETQQCKSLIGTALNDGQDRPETQYSTGESPRFMSDPTCAVKCMLKRMCNVNITIFDKMITVTNRK